MCGDPLAGPLPRRARAPAGRISSVAVRRDRLRARLGRSGGEGGTWLRPRAVQRLWLEFAASRGRGTVLAAPSLPLGGGTGPPASGVTVDRVGLSSVRAQPRHVARAGTGSRKGRQGSAAMSASHLTRLETRTKESNARASQRVHQTPWRNESEVRRVPAEVGSRPLGAGRTTGPSRPLRWGGGA